MGVARRLFSRASGKAVPVKAVQFPEARVGSSVSSGRLLASFDADYALEQSRALASIMFGARLSAAPVFWWRAPLAGIVSADFIDSEVTVECVQLAPGWAAGVLEELAPRFLVIELAALYEGAWAGVLEPGGEHLFDELLALVALAQKQHVMPLLVFSSAEAQQDSPALARLRSAVPAVVGGASPADAEHGRTAASPVVQGILAYCTQKEVGI